MILEYKKEYYAVINRYAVETHIGSVKSVASTVVKNIPYLLSGGVDEAIRYAQIRVVDVVSSTWKKLRK